MTTKMEVAFGLHLKIEFRTIHDFKLGIDSLINQAQKSIWLKGDENDIFKNLEDLNELINDQKLLIISESEKLLSAGLKISALISHDLDNINSLKKRYSNIKIGGLANDIATSKNIELNNGDFVYLGSIQELGDEPYITLIPKNPDYEWRFIDITIPIISYGNIRFNHLKKLTENVNLFGFSANQSDFENLNKMQFRFVTE